MQVVRKTTRRVFNFENNVISVTRMTKRYEKNRNTPTERKNVVSNSW